MGFFGGLIIVFLLLVIANIFAWRRARNRLVSLEYGRNVKELREKEEQKVAFSNIHFTEEKSSQALNEKNEKEKQSIPA